ncbi:MAG: thymidine kinase [Oscillospiraceae bacterium]|nr:thymidine kinase [Oscillospiraceae bacterium]
MSKLYFRYGAMNCGKSTNLLQVAFNYEERGMRVLIIKPKIDTKGSDFVISRLGIKRKADMLVDHGENIFDKISDWIKINGNIHCILVDEVQFFKKNDIDDLFRIAIIKGIPVICYGLRTDFLMNGFEGSERLLLIAHSIEELKNICQCGKKAILNIRKINENCVFEGSQVEIDNKDTVKYEAVCGQCYLKLKGEL